MEGYWGSDLLGAVQNASLNCPGETFNHHSHLLLVKGDPLDINSPKIMGCMDMSTEQFQRGPMLWHQGSPPGQEGRGVRETSR